MSLDGLGLRRRQRVGQRGDDLGAQQAFAGAAAAGLAALVRAHQRERELAGEQFVIGEPRPCRAFRQQVAEVARPVQGLERVGEGREFVALEPSSRPAIR